MFQPLHNLISSFIHLLESPKFLQIPFLGRFLLGFAFWTLVFTFWRSDTSPIWGKAHFPLVITYKSFTVPLRNNLCSRENAKFSQFTGQLRLATPFDIWVATPTFGCPHAHAPFLKLSFTLKFWLSCPSNLIQRWMNPSWQLGQLKLIRIYGDFIEKLGYWGPEAHAPFWDSDVFQ